MARQLWAERLYAAGDLAQAERGGSRRSPIPSGTIGLIHEHENGWMLYRAWRMPGTDPTSQRAGFRRGPKARS